jgi:hypothetical protein
MGEHTSPLFSLTKVANGVISAAKFERAHTLDIFTLQKQFAAHAFIEKAGG